MRILALWWAVLSGAAWGTDGLEPPANPFLADSPWPMSHRNSYVQHSSPFAAPTRPSPNIHFAKTSPVAVTNALSPRYADGSYVLWGSTLSKVYRTLVTPTGMSVVDSMEKKVDRANQVSGAYCVLDRDGVLFVPHGARITTYFDDGTPQSEIFRGNIFEIPKRFLRQKEEAIIGINLTYDGWIAFVTDRGLVGVVARNLSEGRFVSLGKDVEVSNSISVDEDGGIYVVTSKAMERVTWKGGRLTRAWSVPYVSNPSPPGRLGEGSGTTPTLLGWGRDEKFVAIADGRSLMNVVYFWRDTIPESWAGLAGRDRRIAGELPIRFGNPQRETSATEQSLVTRGYEVAAVDNTYGKIPFPKFFSDFYGKATIFLSNEPGVAPYGVEKFGWNRAEQTLERKWANPEVSCPNGIPTMSAAENLFYCIGQKNGAWTVEALDWTTGALVFRTFLGEESKYNSFYAALEVGYDGALLSGTVFGTVLTQ